MSGCRNESTTGRGISLFPTTEDRDISSELETYGEAGHTLEKLTIVDELAEEI